MRIVGMKQLTLIILGKMHGLYQEREWWIPPYMKDMFWAGMRSTQRVESMNSFFDKYLKKQTRLYEFVQQYCKAMERRAEDEKQADAESARFCHQLVSDFPIERVFQKIYTFAKFLEWLMISCWSIQLRIEYGLGIPTLAKTFPLVGNANMR
ncbi:Protein FAR-RED ELONGATED HYPOCOTYL 3 [Bienertia sinuspersici]